MLFVACFVILLCVIIFKKQTDKHEHMSLSDYNCLIANIETKIDGKIIQLVALTPGMMYVVAFSKSVGQTYKVMFDEASLQPTSVYVMGNEPLTEKHLYLKER